MKSRVLLLTLILFLSSGQASANPDGVDEFLQGFVSHFSKTDVDFFYASRPKEGLVYIYWMTGNSILIVDVPPKRLDDYYWYEYKARIDLNSDVVPTADDIHGSTYLTDSVWVEERLKECLNGKKFTIRKEEAE
ncbi:MAG: hypothetical protein IPK77_04450 [Cellvibrio sp.]|nr:hypothetical protein [Cellvibrio sp.]